MRHADKPTAEESIHIAATPEQVWPLVTDITLITRTSEELVHAHWSDPDGVPAVGQTFVGTNRNEYFGEWQTTSTVTECEKPSVFAWSVGDLDEPNTSWRFTVRAEGDGCVVTQWVRLGYGPSGLHLAIRSMPDKEERIVARRMKEFCTGMRANLEEIKRLAESA